MCGFELTTYAAGTAEPVGVRKREYVPLYLARDGIRRHVWIIGGEDRGTLPWPGLLIEWERRDDGWWGRVVFVPFPSEPGEVVERWIAASHLRPAPEPDRPKPTLRG